MSRARCPVCSRRFDPAGSRHLPFCSERCQQIDLGRWLDERYSVPIEREDEDPDDQGPTDDALGED